MTDAEVFKLSTPQERRATRQWKRLQEQAEDNGYMTEGQALEASQVAGILVARNKRLGLIP